jgi:hypothetical protein
LKRSKEGGVVAATAAMFFLRTNETIHLIVLLYSGHGTKQDKLCLKLGFDIVLLKPKRP